MADPKEGGQSKELAVNPKKYNSTNLSLAQMGTIANTLGNSGVFPGVDSGQQAFVKILAGQEFGIAPFAAMTGIHLIQGKATIGANLMASKVKSHPHYDYKVVEHTGETCSIDFFEVNSVDKAATREREKLGNSTFTIEDAKKAGTKNLDKFPKNMLFARAMSNGVRWYCPDVFNGSTVYTPEEFDGQSPADDTITIEMPKDAKDAQPDPQNPAPEPVEGEVVADKPAEEPAEPKIAGIKFKSKIFAQLRDFGFEGNIAKQIIYEATGITSVTNELTIEKATKLIDLLESTTRLKLDQFIERTGIKDKLAAGLAPQGDEADAPVSAEQAAEALGGEVVEDKAPTLKDEAGNNQVTLAEPTDGPGEMYWNGQDLEEVTKEGGIS